MDKATSFTVIVAALTQLLGACYNYKYLITLGIDPSVHPLTLEDNVQTALTELFTFVLSIVFPYFLGFIVKFHSPENRNVNSDENKTEKTYRGKLIHILFVLCIVIIIGILGLNFLSRSSAHYLFLYASLAGIFYLTTEKIEKFSPFNDIPSMLSVATVIGFLVIFNIQKGEQAAIKHRNETNPQYIVKIKNEQEEYLACTAIRTFSNDVLLIQNGKAFFVKKDSVQEITVLN